jgi:hypothetical protein
MQIGFITRKGFHDFGGVCQKSVEAVLLVEDEIE